VQLFESTYRLEWMDDPWEEVDIAGDWLLGIASKFQPDVIHLNGYSHAALPWEAPVLVVAHSCVRSWWRAVRDSAPPRSFDEYTRRVENGLSAANLVVAPTAAMLYALHQEYRASFRGRVIPNAVAPNGFAPRVKRNVICSVGRMWDEAKNIAALDRVASRIQWPIEIAGENIHPNGNTRLFGNVRSLGKLTHRAIIARLSSAAIYALPARYEPFGLSALEAGLCSCALVLGDIPSLREIWEGAAIFVSPDDDRAIEDTLNDLIGDVLQREELGLRARARALEFAPERMASSYLASYEQCLSPQLAEVAA
jgi:glycosyltransferase involved in cell wall biosynthesis